MPTFEVHYTSPDPARPQPATPVDLNESYVFYKIGRDEQIGLKDTNGYLREFRIVEVKHVLDEDGNHESFDMAVL